MLNTPVLFLVFNRPDTTRQVFEAIRKAQPRQLFVAADGPRPGKPGEKEKCEEVRKIATAVDWDCEVKTLFRDENLGCGRGPATAITWFFENVEQGIILEDDCLPHNSFFFYCEELLGRYRNNQNIMLISGLNLFDKRKLKTSYFFSHYAGIWGWATWKRAWEKFDYNLNAWSDNNIRRHVLDFFENKIQREYYQNIFERTFQKDNVTWWDYQWFFARIYQRGIGIIPQKNLITNIGFGAAATHTTDKSSFQASLVRKEINFPLQHPAGIEIDRNYDEEWVRKIWKKNQRIRLLSLLKKKIMKKNITGN
jgi:hypothetical protein